LWGLGHVAVVEGRLEEAWELHMQGLRLFQAVGHRRGIACAIEGLARLAAAQGFTGARPGVLQGTYTYVLQDGDGQIATTHSISAGLDYPAIGPEHAWLADQRRTSYSAVSDAAALDAARTLARTEGIIPALESAHAIAGLIERRGQLTREDLIIVNLSGRGDKDMDTYSRLL